jgi:hypothetical protein
MQRTRYYCQILMKLEFSRQIFEKHSNVKFHENPSSGGRVVACGQTYGETDTKKLIVAFRSLRPRLKLERQMDDNYSSVSFYSPCIYFCVVANSIGAMPLDDTTSAAN